MKKMIFNVPTVNMPLKKRWWQFWRKKGDSAEEAVADIIPLYQYQKEYWFPTSGVDASILRMTRIENIFKKID